MFQLVFPALKRCVVTLLWGWVTNPCVLVSDHCFFKHTLPDKLGLAGYQIDLQLDLYSCREKCLITILFLLSCGVDGSICVEWSLFLMIYEVWKAFESFHSIRYKRAFKIQVVIILSCVLLVNVDVFPLQKVLFVLQWCCRPLSISFLCIYLCWWWFT